MTDRIDETLSPAQVVAAGESLEAERLVREAWEGVNEEVQRTHFEIPSRWHGYVLAGDDLLLASGNRAERWQAALEFTRQRQQEIREIDEEIDVVCVCRGVTVRQSDYDALDRILKRLQAIRADLARGMKEPK